MTMRLLQTHRPFRSRSSEGFTLVELMVVILIIAVLIGAAVPTFIGLRNRAHDSVARQALRNTVTQGRAAAVVEDSAVMFPGPASTDLVTALSPLEPAYEYTVGLSEGPQHISVNRMSGRVAAYAALSRSGTCWYAFDALASEPGTDVAPGTSWAYDDSDDAAEHCGTSNLDFDDIPEGSTEQNPSPIDSDPGAGGPGDVPGGSDGDWASPLACAEDPNCYPASAWGDPHIVTYDGLSYEFQTVGDYIFTRSLPELSAQGHDPVEIHIRTGNETYERFGGISFTTGVAARVDGDVVTVTLDEGLRVNGSALAVDEGERVGLGASPDSPDGAFITRQGSWIRILWPKPDSSESRPQLDVRVRDSYIDFNTYLTTNYVDLVEGVGGIPNDNPYDDLATSGGTQLGVPTSNHVIHTTFADSWAVPSGESLFAEGNVAPKPRDATFPSRFVDHENPAPDFDGFSGDELEEARGFCLDAGVHPNLVVPCQIDYLAADGDEGRQLEATSSALDATIPTVLNSYDNWDQILTFDGGKSPTTYGGWQQYTSSYPYYIASIADEGGWVIDDHDAGRTNYLQFRKENIVGETFTFQTDVKVTNIDPANNPWNRSRPVTYTEVGLEVADGENLWRVRVQPTYVADANAEANDPSARVVTNLHSRFAQVRIVKSGNRAVLYVDGVEAFELTPAAAGGANRIGFGGFNVASGVARAVFDNVAYRTADIGDLGMTTWEPDPWAQTLYFSDEQPPTYNHSWLEWLSESTAGSYISAGPDRGAWRFDDHNTSGRYRNYRIPNTVTEEFTLEARVNASASPSHGMQVAGGDAITFTNAMGMRVSDGVKSYWLRIYPTHVADGNAPVGSAGSVYNVDLLTRFAQLRISKTATGATLFVDGQRALELTPADAAGVNEVAFGFMESSGGMGQVWFDDVSIAGAALEGEGMTEWPRSSWTYSESFDDGLVPVSQKRDVWAWGSSASFAGSYISISNQGGAVVFDDHNSNATQSWFYSPNLVSDEFSFETRVSVTGSSAAAHKPDDARSFTEGLGIRLSDGANSYWVRLYPTHVADGNARAGDPDATYVTNLHDRFAQLRISKTATGATLYVDGQPALHLTPADASGVNEVAFGVVAPSSGFGKATFDDIRFGPTSGAAGMTPWVPSPWSHLLSFDDSFKPTVHGWNHHMSEGYTGSYISSVVEDGRLTINDSNTNSHLRYYYMRNLVPSSGLTFQANLQVASQQGDPVSGVQIANGNKAVTVGFTTEAIHDLVSGESVSVDLTEPHEVRVAQRPDGSGTVFVDGSAVLELTGEASTENRVAFGIVASGSGTKSVTSWDVIRLAPGVVGG